MCNLFRGLCGCFGGRNCCHRERRCCDCYGNGGIGIEARGDCNDNCRCREERHKCCCKILKELEYEKCQKKCLEGLVEVRGEMGECGEI